MKRQIVVYKDEPSGKIIADVPSLGISTYGNTVDQAIDNARDAINLLVESLEARGLEVPPERAPMQVVTLDAGV